MTLRVTCIIAVLIIIAAFSRLSESAFVHCDLAASTNSSVHGDVYFISPNNETVEIVGLIRGLSPGAHGVHIHRDGATGNDCKDAGPHFNPKNSPHGGPGDHELRRHAGDLGNFVADQNGEAIVEFSTEQISLKDGSPFSVVGRALVVHALPDDLGRGGDQESTKTGNAGARKACCKLVSKSVVLVDV